MSVEFTSVACSLVDLIGADLCAAACRARSLLTGANVADLERLASEKVDFWPEARRKRLRELLRRTGELVVTPLASSADGANTGAFQAATVKDRAPLSGMGYYRIGEDGRLYITTKSEHYHTLLGHDFPGYRLLDHARALGIPNATHNNTRGAITRQLEEELIRAANGLAPGDDLKKVLSSNDPTVLNRVLNLQTGSMAVEAALKLALAQFYRFEAAGAEPVYHGRVPVIVVIGDDDGTVAGNYHGTTLSTQILRGLWPDLQARLEQSRALRIVAVRPNSVADLDRVFREFETPPCKIAAFCHEIVMMNYGARRLTVDFLQHAHRLCAEHKVPTIVDEIQSCMWYQNFFLFRQYGLRPSILVLGKGASGGEYSASRILVSAPFDNLPQFGSLVTNGQQELASLAYLVTMRWTAANGAAIAEAGRRIQDGGRQLAREFPSLLTRVEGQGHLMGLEFVDMPRGRRFIAKINSMGFDISVQSYKPNCPPVALAKLPTIVDDEMIDFMIERFREALTQVAKESGS